MTDGMLIETSEVVRRAGIKGYQFKYMLRAFPGILTCARTVGGKYRLWDPAIVQTVVQLRAGMRLTRWGNPDVKKRTAGTSSTPVREGMGTV